MKILEDINVNGSGNFDNELTATSLSSITSLFLQGFELKPYSLDGRTPDRLMYDGYVLLDEYNYGEYLDSAYVTLNSAQTISGTKTFSQDIVGNVNGSAQFIGNNPTKNTNKKSLQIYSGGMAYGDEIDEWNSPHGNNTDQTGLKIDYGTILRLRYSTNYYHDIWFDANKSSIVYRKITNNVSAGWVTILDNLNFSTHLDSAYIKKSGDTVTGQITSSVANGTAPFVVASNTEVANLHSATATKLHTARTIAISGAVTGTATAFDGSSNISINTTSVDASKLSGYAKMYYGHHPEDEGLLPFIYNDLAYLSEVGGACSIYTTTDTDYTKSDLTKESVIAGSYSVMFDCSPRYQGFSLDSTSTVLVIDIDCPTKFSYENKFYIDFGNNSWKANEIKVYVWNDAADNTSKAYKLKAESSSVPARFMASLIYSYSNGTSTVQGFNKLRVILTDFARTNPRIAQIGLINMNSFGARMGYVSRGIDDKLYRNFTPAKNSTYDLGSGNNRWLNIYGTNADFTGSVTTQSIIGVSSKALVISSTNDDLALRRNNTDATSVVLNNSAFKPYNAANGLLDLGASNARWKVIYGLSLDLSGHIYLPNSGMIYAKNASNSYIGLLQFNNINSLLIGQDVAKKGYNTNIYGNNIALCYGTAGSTSNIALYVNSDGNVGIGTIYPTYKLDVNGTFNVSGDATIGGETVATQVWVNSQDFAKASDLTSINNSISSLQASTFTGANAPEGKGYTLTWFTQSGGGRNVTIPAYGEITDGLAGIGQNVALVDQWLIADLISYVDDAVTGGRIDLTSAASDIIPDGNLTRKLGSSSNRWSLLYVNSINAGTIAPRTDNGWDLGMTTFRWRNLYAVDGHLDSLTIGGETAATQFYVTSQLGSYATTSALSNYVTLNTEQTISERKTFSKGIIGGLHSIEAPNSVFVGLDSTVRVYGGLTIGTGDLTTPSIKSDNVLPKSNSSGSIGSSSSKWRNGYINNLYSDVIYADTLTSRTAPYISVTAASLDLMSCELYGYDSDNLDVWNIDFAGNAYFLSVTQTSDVRYKNIKENIHLELSDIAAAPTFKFAWANDIDGSTHIGTSAQYWQEIAGELVVENKKTGKLGLDYSTAALVSAISIAREVNTMKMWQTSTTDRIEELEERVKALEEENKELRELLNSK